MIKFFLVFMGFVSAFSFSGILSLPMIISIMMAGILILDIIKKGSIKKITHKLVIPLFLLGAILLTSYFFQVNRIGFHDTALNHFLSYVGTILMYLIIPILWLKHFNTPMEKVFKYITIGVLIVSLFTIIEFVSKNFLNFPFDDYIYRSTWNQYSPTYDVSGNIFIRARGVAEESGHLAMYLSMFMPFVYHYYKYIDNNKKKLVCSMILVISALFVTFSAIGIVENILALSIVFLYITFLKMRKGLWKREILLVIGIPIIILVTIYTFFNASIFEGIISKLLLGTTSGESRLNRWSMAIELFNQRPILGNGPGATSLLYGTGSTSFYLELLSQIGLIGILLLGIIFIIMLKFIFNLNGNIKYVYLYSSIVMIVHFMVISNYWYPWAWVLFAIVTYHNHLEQSNRQIRNGNLLYERVY